MTSFKRFILLATLSTAVCYHSIECTWSNALKVQVPSLGLAFCFAKTDAQLQATADSLTFVTPLQNLESLLPGQSMKAFCAAADVVRASIRIAF